LRVQSISRETIDAWPLKGSGLPVRIVNTGTSANIKTVGELRDWPASKLLKLRSLGRVTIKQIQSFYEICDQMEKGVLYFNHIKEVFSLFLDHDELMVLTYRYGLDLEGTDTSRKNMTLQEIGSQTNRTRERVRQIEEIARQKLKSRLAARCLQPFCDLYRQVIESLGKATYCMEIHTRIDVTALDHLNVCAALLLLCDLYPEVLTCRNGAFSTLSTQQLEQIEQAAISCLKTAKEPMTLEEISKAIAHGITDAQGTSLHKILMVVLDHTEGVAATTTHQYFLFTNGTSGFLRQLMQEMSLPTHFRELTRNCNGRLKPQSRRGPGFILGILNTYPDFERIDKGLYTIKEEQTLLP